MAAFGLASLLPLPMIALGAVQGGTWLWLAFLYIGVLTILLDQLIPLAAGTAAGTEFPAAEVLLVSLALGHLTILPVAVWAIAGGSGLDPGQRILLFFAAGLWFGQVAHPAAHELIHRPRRELFRLGAAVYVSLLFGQHASAHRLVRHRHVATADDPNSARAGEGFYRFALRAWRGSLVEGLRAETALRDRAQGGARSPHPYVLHALGSGAALGLGLALAGLPGVLAWIGLALHAQGQILLADYVQHYGLTRARRADGRPEPVGLRHSWNTAHWFTSALMLNATRHSDHHVSPARPFPALSLPPEDIAPRLPWPLPVACALALLPGVWRRAMRPHLARWRSAPAGARPAERHTRP